MATATYGSSLGAHERPTPIGPYLVVAINSERPLSYPTRVALDGVERTNLWRGPERLVRRREEDGGAVSDVFLADTTMSANHAFVACTDQEFWLWDCGSRNGTSLNGDAVTEPTKLLDGDIIGVGRTYLLFRSASEVAGMYASNSSTQRAALPLTWNPCAMQTHEFADQLAKERVPLLMTGPKASGRRTLARWIHARSGMSGPFVEVEASELLENLFAFKESRDGTLYLRDIDAVEGETSLALLRAVERGEISLNESTSGARIIASGSPRIERQLPKKLESFFSDVVVRLQSLAHRREDIGYFAADALAALGAPLDIKLRRSAARALLSHDWPGGVGELRAAIEQGLAFAEKDTIHLKHLSAAIQETESSALERRRLVELLDASRGNVSAVARALGKDRRAVHLLAERHGIDFERFRLGARGPLRDVEE